MHKHVEWPMAYIVPTNGALCALLVYGYANIGVSHLQTQQPVDGMSLHIQEIPASQFKW
jgi:hypothetical protein